MSRFLRLALLVAGLGGCSSTILLGNPYPDGGESVAGPVPTVAVFPNPLDFGSVSADAGNVDGGLTFFNPGGVVAVISVFPPDGGPFSAVPITRPLTPGPVMTPFAVLFAPTQVGSFQSHLDYNVCAKVPDGGAPLCSAMQSIRLQGKGF